MNNTIYTAPAIIKESSRGFDAVSLTTEMFSRREINCFSEINTDSVNSMIMQILELEKQDPNKEITIFINSPGGSVIDGLALYDVMQAVSCPITTVCVGMAASMGSILFAAGNKRLMLPHSKIMIHDPRITETGGTALGLQTVSQNLMKTRQITAEILAKHTGKDVSDILDLTRDDTWFTAEEAFAFNLCDSIVDKL